MLNEKGMVMKRFICVLLVLCVVPFFSLSESIDLSVLSFDELRVLQTRISQELTTRPEWKGVTVPEGFYEVGVDIPAGKWEIKCGEKSSFGYVSVQYGNNVTDSGAMLLMPMEWTGLIYKDGQGMNRESLTLNLSEGYFLEIKMGQAVFSIPEKIDLGF